MSRGGESGGGGTATRRLVATVGLVVLVALAGCSYDDTIGVRPVVDAVEPTGSDEYRMTVTVAVDNVDDTTFSDVRVSGYSIDGERLCSMAVGDIASNATREMTCPEPPSLLLAETADMNETVQGGGLASYTYTVEGTATLYVGLTRRGHEYDYFTSLPDRFGPIRYRDDRPTVTDGGRRLAYCRQWRSSLHGADFSALGGTAWNSWEYRQPETERFFGAVVENESYYDRTGYGDRVQVGPNPPVVAVDDLPPSLRRIVEDGGFTDDTRPARLDQRSFDGLLANVTGRSVESTADRTAAMRTMTGSYERYNRTWIDCSRPVPTHIGRRGETAAFLVDAGDTTFAVELETGERYRGPAVNRTGAD